MKKLLFAFAFISTSIFSQEYPTRPVTAIIPFSSGSASDVIARIVLERVSASVGQRFLVDNRPAAGGIVGTGQAAKAEADGYTLVMGASGPLVVNKILNPAVTFDPERDFQPISLYANLPNIVTVSAKTSLQSLAELIQYVKESPDTPYSSVGNGSSQHLAGALFSQLTGAKMQHVPYRITAQLSADLISGQVPLSFQLLPNVIGGIKSGQLRPLAVAAKNRLPALPNVPTAAEAGVKGYESSAWFGFVGPRGMPKPAVDRLAKEVAAATADPAVRGRFADFGAEPLGSTPEEFGRFISSELARYREIITRGGITLDP